MRAYDLGKSKGKSRQDRKKQDALTEARTICFLVPLSVSGPDHSPSASGVL